MDKPHEHLETRAHYYDYSFGISILLTKLCQAIQIICRGCTKAWSNSAPSATMRGTGLLKELTMHTCEAKQYHPRTSGCICSCTDLLIQLTGCVHPCMAAYGVCGCHGLALRLGGASPCTSIRNAVCGHCTLENASTKNSQPGTATPPCTSYK